MRTGVAAFMAILCLICVGGGIWIGTEIATPEPVVESKPETTKFVIPDRCAESCPVERVKSGDLSHREPIVDNTDSLGRLADLEGELKTTQGRLEALEKNRDFWKSKAQALAKNDERGYQDFLARLEKSGLEGEDPKIQARYKLLEDYRVNWREMSTDEILAIPDTIVDDQLVLQGLLSEKMTAFENVVPGEENPDFKLVQERIGETGLQIRKEMASLGYQSKEDVE
jgi:hypothetical protein